MHTLKINFISSVSCMDGKLSSKNIREKKIEFKTQVFCALLVFSVVVVFIFAKSFPSLFHHHLSI
jgi:hypothetical protein